MSKFKNLLKHLHLIHTHRKFVRSMCFKMGIPWQGLTHDLSKYSLKELSICKYYDGTRSPHEKARDELGYSPSWLYHKAKNKHHWEFWTDNNSDSEFYAVKMPYKYALESFCDMVGAGKAYMKKDWDPSQPLEYFNAHKEKRLYYPATKKLLSVLFEKLNDVGEYEFVRWYKLNKKMIQKWYEDYDCNKGLFQ